MYSNNYVGPKMFLMKGAIEYCVICYETLHLLGRCHTIDRHASWNSDKDAVCTV